MDEEETFMC